MQEFQAGAPLRQAANDETFQNSRRGYVSLPPSLKDWLPPGAEVVAEHQRMVVQLAMNLLSDRDEAMDLSQEVFLRVFRTMHRFRGQSSLRTWIYRIAVNQARNRHRFWRRRHRADQRDTEPRPEAVEPGASNRTGGERDLSAGEPQAR